MRLIVDGPANSLRWNSAVQRLSLTFALAVLLSGCAVSWITSYNQQSFDRVTDISKSALAVFQSVLSTPVADRKALVNGTLKSKYGDVATSMRVHLLSEQSREKNKDSIEIAQKLLASWEEVIQGHGSGPTDRLSDTALKIERSIVERELASAFKAEEAKKLGGSSSN